MEIILPDIFLLTCDKGHSNEARCASISFYLCSKTFSQSKLCFSNVREARSSISLFQDLLAFGRKKSCANLFEKYFRDLFRFVRQSVRVTVANAN